MIYRACLASSAKIELDVHFPTLCLVLEESPDFAQLVVPSIIRGLDEDNGVKYPEVQHEQGLDDGVNLNDQSSSGCGSERCKNGGMLVINASRQDDCDCACTPPWTGGLCQCKHKPCVNFSFTN